jgi:hypothetical protein
MHKHIGLAVLFLLILGAVALNMNQHSENNQSAPVQQTDSAQLPVIDRNTAQNANNNTLPIPLVTPTAEVDELTAQSDHAQFLQDMKHYYQQAQTRQPLDELAIQHTLSLLNALEHQHKIAKYEAAEHRQWLADHSSSLASEIAQQQQQANQAAQQAEQQRAQVMQQTLAADTRFNRYKQAEAQRVQEIVSQYPEPSPERDALIQQQLDALHQQIYGAGNGL